MERRRNIYTADVPVLDFAVPLHDLPKPINGKDPIFSYGRFGRRLSVWDFLRIYTPRITEQQLQTRGNEPDDYHYALDLSGAGLWGHSPSLSAPVTSIVLDVHCLAEKVPLPMNFFEYKPEVSQNIVRWVLSTQDVANGEPSDIRLVFKPGTDGRLVVAEHEIHGAKDTLLRIISRRR